MDEVKILYAQKLQSIIKSDFKNYQEAAAKADGIRYMKLYKIARMAKGYSYDFGLSTTDFFETLKRLEQLSPVELSADEWANRFFLEKKKKSLTKDERPERVSLTASPGFAPGTIVEAASRGSLGNLMGKTQHNRRATVVGEIRPASRGGFIQLDQSLVKVDQLTVVVALGTASPLGGKCVTDAEPVDLHVLPPPAREAIEKTVAGERLFLIEQNGEYALGKTDDERSAQIGNGTALQMEVQPPMLKETLGYAKSVCHGNESNLIDAIIGLAWKRVPNQVEFVFETPNDYTHINRRPAKPIEHKKLIDHISGMAADIADPSNVGGAVAFPIGVHTAVAMALAGNTYVPAPNSGVVEIFVYVSYAAYAKCDKQTLELNTQRVNSRLSDFYAVDRGLVHTQGEGE